MKIIRLEAANVKRLRAVEVRPKDGEPLVIVRGNNGAGKSSLLDSIRMAFGGKSTHPPKVVREGEREAHVEVETEELVVLRRWDADGTTELEVRAKDGTKLKSPQGVLEKLYADTAFDPLEFTRLKPAEQQEQLRRIVGVDTAAIDRERQHVFEERTVVNRQLSSAEAKLKAMPKDPPPARVDVAAFIAEQGKLAEAMQLAQSSRIERDAALRRVKDCEAHVATCESALKQAKEKLAMAQKHAAEADNVCDERAEATEGTSDRLAILAQTLQAAQTNAVAHATWTERQKLEKEVGELRLQTDNLTATLSAGDARRKAMIDGAEFPVPGLGFSDGGVTFNELPLEQASQAEQLRVSVAICVARNPKLRVALVKDGSLLDDKSLGLLAKLCREKDLQVWLEMVNEEGPASVVIRDGSVVE
jgi:DNA repair exonuclease SbcCD ATPase subunit